MTQRCSNAMRLCAGTALLAMLAGCAVSAPTLPGTSEKTLAPQLAVQTGDRDTKDKKDKKDKMGSYMQGQQPPCDGQMQKQEDKPAHQGVSAPVDQGLALPTGQDVSTQPQIGQQNLAGQQGQLPISQSDVSQSNVGQDLSQGQSPPSATDTSMGQTSSDMSAHAQTPVAEGSAQASSGGSCPPPEGSQQSAPPSEHAAPQGQAGQPTDQGQMAAPTQGY